MLSKKLVFLIDPNRHEELRFVAYQKATTIGSLVREAIDIYLTEKRYTKGGDKHKITQS